MEDGKFHPHTNHQSAVHASDIQQNNIKVKKKNLISLENRAWKGLRVVSRDFLHHGKKIFITVDTHHVQGNYIVEEFDGNTQQPTSTSSKKFTKYSEVESYLKNHYNLPVKREIENNAHQTWQQNISQTDHELPYDEKFWHLPEHVRERINGESTEEFIKKLQKKKSRYV